MINEERPQQLPQSLDDVGLRPPYSADIDAFHALIFLTQSVSRHSFMQDDCWNVEDFPLASDIV